jgi:hypothetical protein
LHLNIINPSTLDYISALARVQGLAHRCQPYKDAGLEFGGRRVTKRNAESANKRTVVLGKEFAAESLVAQSMELVTSVYAWPANCQKIEKARDRSCRFTVRAASTPKNVRIKLLEDKPFPTSLHYRTAPHPFIRHQKLPPAALLRHYPS